MSTRLRILGVLLGLVMFAAVIAGGMWLVDVLIVTQAHAGPPRLPRAGV